ncbi:hypothetical protein ACQR06_33225, partial [Bradyrhizobium sp. HKCCYLRH1065]|uniref:hypothetical protein n=1 Tax=Bradyrhizobium sp. HKCCYLRH1065 TaxID=3420753 RepID=UPI003EBCD4FB
MQRGFGCADEQSRCGREVAWSWPPDAEVKPERDARASAQAMGAIKPVPRESAKEALKPSRREGWGWIQLVVATLDEEVAMGIRKKRSTR